jgi:hemerythrin
MDEEHQICTDSFNRALKDPTVETLQEVYELLNSHFAHEEELIEKYAISAEQAASPFSALTSHRKDHHRILAIASIELDRVINLHNANASCSVVAGAKA